MPKKTITKKAVKKTAKKAVKKTLKKAVKKVSKKSVKKATKKTKGCSCKKKCVASECFWVNNGPVIDSLGTLKKALQKMSDEQYKYHTTREGNDFAQWIENCLNNKTCAIRVVKAKTRSSAVRALTGSCACRK